MNTWFRKVAPLFVCFCLIVFNSCCKKQESLSDLRLIDYEPKSMLVTKVTKIQKAGYPVIDAHNHLHKIVDSKDDISKYVKIMDECNVQAVVDLDGGYGTNLENHLKVLGEYPGRFIVFAKIDWTRINDPDFTDYSVKQLEEAVKMGVRGLKIGKNLGLRIKEADGAYLRVDSPKLDPVWAKCADLNIPVLIHTSDPAAFFTPLDKHNEWLEILANYPNWLFNKPEYYTRDELLQQRNNIIKKHKNTIFIGAHVGNNPENLGKVAEWLDKYPNFYVDISARLGELGRQPYTTRKFMIKYADRVMFGTDGYKATPVNKAMYESHFRFLESDDEYMDIQESHTVVPKWRVYGLYLPDDVLEKIYYLNARKIIYGIEG